MDEIHAAEAFTYLRQVLIALGFEDIDRYVFANISYHYQSQGRKGNQIQPPILASKVLLSYVEFSRFLLEKIGPTHQKLIRDKLADHLIFVYVGDLEATIWTDVEFLGISGSNSKFEKRSGSYHEADILMIKHDSSKIIDVKEYRPKHFDVLAIIECKHIASMPKAVLRGLLGLRREMSIMYSSKKFETFTNAAHAQDAKQFSTHLPMEPASNLIFYYPSKFDPSLTEEWEAPGTKFGIEFWSY